jgi:hypothetical protein
LPYREEGAEHVREGGLEQRMRQRKKWAATGERKRATGEREPKERGRFCCFLLKISFSFLFKTILQTEFEYNSNKVLI